MHVPHPERVKESIMQLVQESKHVAGITNPETPKEQTI
jgi:hypothetical protein